MSDAAMNASAVAPASAAGPTASAPPLLVAIDGPAGSGKSSVSHAAADRLAFGILDTGAAYRSLAWAALRAGVDLDDERAVLELLETWGFTITMRGEQWVTVTLPAEEGAASGDPVDVTAEIRDPAVSAQVSRVSKHPAVRERLNEMFRRIVAASGLPGVVIEGRDITTVVAPEAPVRILMTASPEVRAQRRAGELADMSHEQVLADIAARDAKDALVVDFFTPAPGVTLVDTSDLNFEQSIQAVVDIVRAVQRAAEESKR
ncbi:cytidylate kinase [Leucobacter sp. UCD-THU]|nr:cytidylate kinase [Leucobacter sp. UCD-THU]